MKEDHYISLLYRKLSNQLNSTEAGELASWLGASEENRQMAESVEKAWDLSKDYERKDVKIDLDADFTALESKMDVAEPSPVRKKARVHQMPPRRNWLSVAAVFVALVAVGFLLRNYFADSFEIQQLSLGPGQTELLEFGDGTKVWVNENTTILYPKVFARNERSINLSGEAYFEVTKNPAQPFVITTANGEVKVLGTSFNVRDYSGEGEMEVEVTSGKVQLKALEKTEKIILNPNEKGILNKDEKVLRKETDQLGNSIAWHTDKLVFKESPLKTVVETLEKRYGVEIDLAYAAIEDCPFTATFESKSLATILSTIESVFSMKLDKQNDQKYTFAGGLCQ